MNKVKFELDTVERVEFLQEDFGGENERVEKTTKTKG